jgi:hypothetical protein
MSSKDFLAPRKINKYANTPEFQFINITEPKALDDITKMTVRVQALREFNRKKRLLESLNGASAPLQPRARNKKEPGYLQRFKVDASGLHPTRTQPRSRFVPTGLTIQYPTQDEDSNVARHETVDDDDNNQSQALVDDTPTLMHGAGCACFLLHHTTELGTGELDPFGSLPVPQTRRVRLLLNNREPASPILCSFTSSLQEESTINFDLL